MDEFLAQVRAEHRSDGPDRVSYCVACQGRHAWPCPTERLARAVEAAMAEDAAPWHLHAAIAEHLENK